MSSSNDNTLNVADSTDRNILIPDDENNAVNYRLQNSQYVLSSMTATALLPKNNKPYLLDEIIEQTQSEINSSKVILKLKPIGATPLLRQNIYRISGNQKFGTLVKYIRKQLKCSPSQQIFCYINNSFAPPLDEPIINLYNNFQIEGNLMISYCFTVAFG